MKKQIINKPRRLSEKDLLSLSLIIGIIIEDLKKHNVSLSSELLSYYEGVQPHIDKIREMERRNE